MDTSRNKFSNLISIAFSVCLASLVCFSIGIRFGIDNMVSRAIIAAVYCGIVVGLAFALNKVVNKVQERSTKINRDKLYAISIIIDAVLFVTFRLLIISDVIKVEFSTSNVFEMAKIGEDGKIFANLLSIDGVVATILSCMFKLFGNTFFPVYLFQFIVSIFTFVLLVLSVKKLIGELPSAISGFGFAVLPIFFKAIASDSADGIIVLLFALYLFVVAKYKESIEEDTIKIWFSLIIGIISGIYSLYSALLMLSVVVAIVVLWNFTDEDKRNRAINTFVILVGNIIGFGLGVILDTYLFAKTGAVGFADEIIMHLQHRFAFSSDFNLLHLIAEDTSVFFLMILCIIYCVMYWKNEEDSAHILGTFLVLFVVELVGIRLNNPVAAMMIFAIALMVIGGCGIFDLGCTESGTRIYRIDDDMQPAVISSIDDKPVVKNDSVSIKDEKTEEVVDESTNTDVVEGIIDDAIEEQNTSESPAEVINVETDSKEIDNATETNEAVKEERKYVESEVRKSTNYGINDADFESLFSATSVPPKFVYNDIYPLPEDEEMKVNEDPVEGINNTDVSLEESETKEDNENVIENESEANTTEEVIDDSKDKKAYVDSFFGYLYDDSKEFEAFEPLKPLEDMPEEKEEVVETYVSHADKFADLDLDLGVDAFDNIIVTAENSELKEEETTIEVIETETKSKTEFESELLEEKSEEAEMDTPVLEKGIADEFVFEENNDVMFDVEIIEDEAQVQEEVFVFDSNDKDKSDEELFEEDEYSVEEMLQKKIDEDFSYEEAISNRIINEEIEKEIGFSYEEALEKKLDVENAINEAIKRDSFSYEEAINNKIIAEDVVIDAIEDDNISVVESINSKLEIEDSIKDTFEDTGFSYQEAIETKLDVEQSIENATTEKILEEFGSDELFENIEIDFSGKDDLDDNQTDHVDEVQEENLLHRDEHVIVIEELQDVSVNEEPQDEIGVEVEKAQDDKLDDNEEEAVQFIENPLPLPKKHVHREMDYGRVIPSAWMHYDIELDNKNNHYDI